MRGLSGDFKTMPLRDVVVYLGNKQATGRLVLERKGLRKDVSLRDGAIVNASSTDPREYLGQFLINMGHITEDQFHKAYRTQKETHIFLGKILVMIGIVSEETVMSALSLKMRETLLEAFLWEDGEFAFDPNNEVALLDGLDHRIDLLDIHREGEFRETAWQAIRSAFPSGNVRLAVNVQNVPEATKPGSLDDRIAKLAQDGLTIDEMALALHATDFYFYQRLYALYRLDAVRPAQAGDDDGGAEPASDEDLIVADEVNLDNPISAAEILMAQAQWSDAEALLRKAQEQTPSTELADLLRKAETGLLGELRRVLGGRGKTASLLVGTQQLRSLRLTAPERYLLSRVDGQRDVEAIVQVSPLRELEALKLFKSLVDRGLVRVGTPRP